MLMYENITYEELKALSEDEKTKALKELIEKYPDKKQLTARLGVAPVAIMNLIRKYVDGKPIGRANQKKQAPQADQIQKLPQEAKQEPEQDPQSQQVLQQEQPHEVKIKRKYNRKVKPEVVIKSPKVEKVAYIKPEPVKDEAINISISNVTFDSFSITIRKAVSGEDAQFLLNGISNTLLKNQKYIIDVKITEE